MSDSEKIRDVQYNFSNFLWHNLMEIHELESRGHYTEALILSVDLVKYLPPVVRAELEKHVREIKREIELVDEPFLNKHHFVRLLMRERKKNALAKKLLDDFICKMISLLDKRGYLEKRTPRYTIEDFPEVE